MSVLAQQCAQSLERSRLYEAEQRARVKAEAAQQRQTFLAEASAAFASSLDYEVTLAAVARLMVPQIADWCSVDMWQPDQTVKRLAVAHVDPEKVAWAYEIWERYPLDMNALSGLPQVLRTGQPELYPDIPETMIAAATPDPEQLAIIRKVGFSSVIIVPLIAHDQVLGGLTLVWAESGRHYDADDLAFAQELAHRAAIAVDNARLYDEMRVQRERLQVTLASIGDAVIATDERGCVTFMNAIAERLTGWRQDEAIGKRLEEVFQIVNAISREAAISPVARVIREGVIVGLANHTLLISKTGIEMPIDDSGAPIRGEDGTIEGVILVFRDVTERERIETNQEFLLEAGALLASSLDAETTFGRLARLLIPKFADNCAIDLVETDGTLRRVAVAATDPQKEAVIHEITRRYPPKRDQVMIQNIIEMAESMIVTEMPEEMIEAYARDAEHARLLRQVGTHSLIRIPLITRQHVVGLISIGMAESGRHYGPADLTFAQELARRAALAMENVRLYQEAQQAIQARDEFLSVAAHELKTPVTSLRGFAQALLRQLRKNNTVEPTRLEQALTVMDQQSVKLTSLVGQLLDISRVEAGRLILNRQMTDLVRLVRDVAVNLQRSTTTHPIALHAPAELSAFVDSLRLEQVLINLLDNAIKYSPQGGTIEVDLSLADAQTARLTVTDHGMGIPPERRERIFDRFYQAHQDGYLGGMGLGLYISRQIIELHQGRIEAEFPPEGGTRFVVLLPVQERE